MRATRKRRRTGRSSSLKLLPQNLQHANHQQHQPRLQHLLHQQRRQQPRPLLHRDPGDRHRQGRLLPASAAAARPRGLVRGRPRSAGPGQCRGPPLHLPLEHLGAVPPESSGTPSPLHHPRGDRATLRRLRRDAAGVFLRPEPDGLQGHPQLPGGGQTAAASGAVCRVAARRARLLGRGPGSHGALLPPPYDRSSGRRGGERAQGGGVASEEDDAEEKHHGGREGPRAPGRGPEGGGGEPSLGIGRQDVRLPLRGHGAGHRHQPLHQHHAGPQGRGDQGGVFSEVSQHVRGGVRVRRLVHAGVRSALRQRPEQAGVRPRPPQHHRRHRHPPVLRVAGRRRQRRVAGRGGDGRRQRLPGQAEPDPAAAARPEDPVRDAAGSPLAGPADAGPDHAAQHEGVRPAAAVRLRGRHALLAPGPPGGERAGAVCRHAPSAQLQQHPGVLLVGHHLHDYGGLRRHGAAQHPRTDGGADQHPEWNPHHGVSRHLHLPHVLPLLPGAETGVRAAVEGGTRRGDRCRVGGRPVRGGGRVFLQGR